MDIALITGASSGLGAHFARKVSRRYTELDEIWIVARREERLQKLAEELTEVKIRLVALDLTDDAAFDRLAAMMEQEKPSIRLLINNAGYCDDGRFDEMSKETIRKMIDLNITSLTMLDFYCLPYMDEGSRIIHTCSVSSFAPVVNQAVYSASKAYVRFFSQALREELRVRRINVTTLCPGNMDTEMNVRGDTEKAKAAKLPYLDVPSLAEKTLRRADAGKGFYTPGWFYKGYRFVSHILPNYLMMQISKGTF